MKKRILGLLLVICLCLAGAASANTPVSFREFNVSSAELNAVSDTLLIRDGNTRKYQVVDLEGNPLSGTYSDASIRDGFFRVENGSSVNGYGLLDGQGLQVMPMAYGDIDVISDRWQAGIVLTKATAENYDYKSWSGNGFYLVDHVDIYFRGEKKGELSRMDWKYASAYGNFLCVRNREEKYTFYDQNLTPSPRAANYSSEYDEVKNVVYHQGSGQEAFTASCTLTPDDVERSVWEIKGSIVDLQGNVIGDVSNFYSTSRAEGSLIKVRNKAGYYGLVDLSGKEVIPMAYDSLGYDLIGAQKIGYIYAVKNGMGGFVNLANGKETGFLYSEDIDTDRAAYIEVKNLDGNIILLSAAAGQLPVNYKETRTAYSNNNNANTFAIVQDTEGKTGVIDMWGDEVVPMTAEINGTYNVSISNDGKAILCSMGSNRYVIYKVEGSSAGPVEEEAPVEAADESWTCENGHEGQTAKFCTVCGAPKPPVAWTCENGHEGQTGNFCGECGAPKP